MKAAADTEALIATSGSLLVPPQLAVDTLTRRALSNVRFQRLSHGDWREYSTPSDADAAFCMRLARNGGDLPTIVSSVGMPLSPRCLGWSFDAGSAKAKVRRIRLHDMRHTSASLDLASGTSVKAVAARLGHADASVTLRVYAHALRTRRLRLHSAWACCCAYPTNGPVRCTGVHSPAFVHFPGTFHKNGEALSLPVLHIQRGYELFLGCLAGHDPATSCSTDKRSAD